MKDNTLLWWGYKHTNGHYQVKRYFDYRDIKEANDSPFVVEASAEPFEAEDRADALDKLKHILS